jgi:hypothetical protein
MNRGIWALLVLAVVAMLVTHALGDTAAVRRTDSPVVSPLLYLPVVSRQFPAQEIYVPLIRR